MSDSQNDCEYQLDPNDSKWKERGIDPEVLISDDDLDEDGVWNCPHDTVQGAGLCIFHLPVSEKESNEVAQAISEATSESSSRTGESEAGRKTEFIGANFGSLQLDRKTIECVSTIDFRISTFEGDVSAKYADFDSTVDFSGSTFESKAMFEGSNFAEDLRFDHVKFREKALFKSLTVDGTVDFTNVLFEDFVTYRGSFFRGNVDFSDSEFKKDPIAGNLDDCAFDGDLTFEWVDVCGDFGIEGSVFNSNISLAWSTFESDVAIIEMKVFGDLNLEQTKFRGHILFTSDFPQIMQEFIDTESSTLVGDVRIDGEVNVGHRRNYQNPKERLLFSHASKDE